MPKKFVRKYHRKTYRRKVKRNQQLVTIHNPRGFVSPFPPRLRTKFVCTSYGYWTITTPNTTFGVYGNDLSYPFNVGAGLTTMSNPATALGGLQPNGFTTLVGSGGSAKPYQCFRVFGSSIEIRMTPATSADSFFLAVAPLSLSGTGMTSTPYSSYVTISQGPYSKVRVCNIGETSVVRASMTSAKIFGKKRQAVQDDDEFIGNSSNNPTNLWGWQVIAEQQSRLNITAAIGIMCRIIYDVELFGMNTAALPDT